MPTRHRRRDQGKREAQVITRKLGDELRDARLSAGLSLRAVALAAGISKSHVHRIEQARVPWVPLRSLAILFAVSGMRLSARPYPDGPPLRDVAHAQLLRRFRSRLHPSLRFRTEVPVHGGDHLRAWDARIDSRDGTCKVEAETVLYDIQAQERRLGLKMADDGVDVVILVVARTRRNQAVLREFADLLRDCFPLKTREVLGHLGAGRLPDRSGIVLC